MSIVSLTLLGETYRIGCAPGEEGRIAVLAHELDQRMRALLHGHPGTPPPDHMLLLMAALGLADELHEARNAASGQLHAPQDAAAPQDAMEYDTLVLSLAHRIEAVAARLENL